MRQHVATRTDGRAKVGSAIHPSSEQCNAFLNLVKSLQQNAVRVVQDGVDFMWLRQLEAWRRATRHSQFHRRPGHPRHIPCQNTSRQQLAGCGATKCLAPENQGWGTARRAEDGPCSRAADALQLPSYAPKVMFRVIGRAVLQTCKTAATTAALASSKHATSERHGRCPILDTIHNAGNTAAVATFMES